MMHTNSFHTTLKRNFHSGFLTNTFYFFRRHFPVIIGVGLIAGFGRVIQLGGFGPVSSLMHMLLEVMIESARIALVFYVLGLANIKNGVLRMKRFFTEKENRRLLWNAGIEKLKKQWRVILINFIAFLLISWTMNYLIDLLAYKTCLYLALKQGGILAPTSSEWTILLFFKNISIIPFTLVFETLFLLWLANKSIQTIKN
jgi:hypothetical protein